MSTMEALRAGEAPPLALAFADWARRLHLRLDGAPGDGAELVALGAAAVCTHLEDGHICVMLADLAGSPAMWGAVLDGTAPLWPQLEPWRAALRNSPLVGSGDSPTPLVLDGADRLYLHRYWRYEDQLAVDLATRAATMEPVDQGVLDAGIDRLFQPEAEVVAQTGGVDWQAAAARLAAERRLTIITGGPGTGKTTTVVRLLAVLVEQARAAGRPLPRIGLMAPTGKAAARMGEAVKARRQLLDCDEVVKAAIPDRGATLHRALGWQPRSPSRFRHDAANPLPLDVVVVDEASMVPLSLMAKLVAAVPVDGRLVLLGDKDQLASVEPGAVLGELCASPSLEDNVVDLLHSYRNAAHPSIGALAAAVNAGDAAAAHQLLASADHPDVWQVGLSAAAGGPRGSDLRHLRAVLEREARTALSAYLSSRDPRDAFAAFEAFRVLCAHRRGPLGVERLNDVIVDILARQGLDIRQPFFNHRPVMVTENDHSMQLYNGDVGIVLPVRPSSLERCVWFVGQDGEPRAVPLGRLPPHETAFALTVHKSQGSEFDRVLLVLPHEPGPLLTRELVYTGITRARQGVLVYGRADVLTAGIEQQTRRASGLLDALARASSGATQDQ